MKAACRCCLTCAEFKDEGVWVGCSWGFTPVVASTGPEHMDLSGPFPMVLWLWARLDVPCRTDLASLSGHPWKPLAPAPRALTQGRRRTPDSSLDQSPSADPAKVRHGVRHPPTSPEQDQSLPDADHLNLHQGHKTVSETVRRITMTAARKARMVERRAADVPPFICPKGHVSPGVTKEGKPRRACIYPECYGRAGGKASAARRGNGER